LDAVFVVAIPATGAEGIVEAKIKQMFDWAYQMPDVVSRFVASNDPLPQS